MKKTFRLLIAAAVAITALASCTKETATEDIIKPQLNNGQRIITIACDSDTRTGQDYDWHKVHFVEGDQIKVMDSSGMETCTVHVTDGVASFSTSLTGELTAVYPKECGSKTGSAQTITVTTDPPHFQDGTLASGHIASAQIPAGSTKAVFHNETALLRIIPPAGTSKITVTSLSESYNISDGKVSGGVSNEAKRSVVVGDGTKELGTCYVSIHPGVTIGSLSFDTGFATKNLTSGLNTKAGTAYTISNVNWVDKSTLPDGKTFNSYMKSLAGSLSNISGIQFYRSMSNPQGGIEIAKDVYMSYSDGKISVKTSKTQYTANKDCSYMFDGCKNATFINGLSNVNTSATTDMGGMFNDCYKLTSVNLTLTGDFTTANVTNMANMFYSCESLETLDLSNFNTRYVKNMMCMFEWCWSLKEVYLGKDFVMRYGDLLADEMLLGCYATWYGTTKEMESFLFNLREGSDYYSGNLQFAIDMGDAGWWSAWNLGASKPEDYGDYYAWGETAPYYEKGYAKEDPQQHWKSGYEMGYCWSNYKWRGEENKIHEQFSKYVVDSNSGTVDNKTVLEKNDDAAVIRWGGKWRMPTKDDCFKLRSCCERTWTKSYNGTGANGYIYKSKSTGNSIFLPAAGYRYDQKLHLCESSAAYWSSSLDETYWSSYAHIIDNREEDELTKIASVTRYYGLTIRPISD